MACPLQSEGEKNRLSKGATPAWRGARKWTKLDSSFVKSIKVGRGCRGGTAKAKEGEFLEEEKDNFILPV